MTLTKTHRPGSKSNAHPSLPGLDHRMAHRLPRMQGTLSFPGLQRIPR